MRTIKFRCWDIVKKEMFTVFQWHKGDEYDFVVRLVSFNGSEKLYIGIDVILEQFTGLLDKNGKEIYEGDIVQGSNGKKFIVYWSDKDIAFKIKTFPQIWAGQEWNRKEDYYFGQYRTFAKYGDGTTPLDKLEIIGNIHSNGDLIK